MLFRRVVVGKTRWIGNFEVEKPLKLKPVGINTENLECKGDFFIQSLYIYEGISVL